jgi:threonine dehydratase
MIDSPQPNLTNSMTKPTLKEIYNARELLRTHFGATRLVRADKIGGNSGRSVYLKLETELPTGTFKVRGAMVALCKALERGPVSEVIASSTGNHGAAVAYAAKKLGVKARIFLPSNPNPVKRRRIAELGAEIVESGGLDLASAFAHAAEYGKQPSVYFLNDATDPVLPAGPATIGCEILEQLPSVSAVFVPVGDTALIRGVAAAVKQLSSNVKIVGVQAERAPAYSLSWREGRTIGTETCDTIADGLATRTPEEENVDAIRELVDDMVLVSERQLLHAIRLLLLDEQVVAEPAGAAATAGFLTYKGDVGEDVALLVTGANLTQEILTRASTIAEQD